MYDIVIKNGTVIDGTRMPRFRSDVGIIDGRVAKIGRITDTGSARVLDAQGCYVAPGFVDLHTHYDAQIHWDPYCTISGWHGVTSVVLGNCGFGFAPVKKADRDRSMLMMTRTEQISYETMQAGMVWNWETFPEWLDNLQAIPKGLNLISYVPVTPLMVWVMGLEASKTRPATEAERKEMQRLLHEAMDAGACGFSIQRQGKHSAQADFDGTPMPTDTMTDEDILALAEVLYERDEGVIQITQQQFTAGEAGQESDDPLAGWKKDHAFLEKLAEVSGRPVLHNLIAVSPDNDPAFHERELAWLHDANERGLRIYGQGNSVRAWMDFTLKLWNGYDSSPTWNDATQGTDAERIQKMSDPAKRQKMREEYPMLLKVGTGPLPENLTVLTIPDAYPDLKKHQGRRVGDIAKENDLHPNDQLLDIAIATGLDAVFRTEPLVSDDPDLVGPLMADPFVIAGVSDGGAHCKFFTGGSYTTDFLTWLVRDEKKMSLEEAHYHLSYMPAQASGFQDRGYLHEGGPADVIVYNLQQLKRLPEWDMELAYDWPADEWRMVQRSEGYRWTIVNGVITFEDGECTGAMPGLLLRNGQESIPFAIAAE